MLKLLELTLLLQIVIAYEYVNEAKPELYSAADLEIIKNTVIDEARIIRGEPADEGQFLYTVALTFYKTFVCTGSIISPSLVLTAAHCLFIDGEKAPASLYIGTIGSANRSSSEAINITFTESIVHPEFEEETLRNDIALLRTATPIVMSNRVQKICIASAKTRRDSYKHATIMGWGSTTSPEHTYPDVLHYTEVKLIFHLACKLRYIKEVNDDMICADGFGKGICRGDSGGPMVHSANNDVSSHVQIGIASFVRSPNSCGSFIVSPGVMTRVSSFEAWIREVSNDTEICSM